MIRGKVVSAELDAERRWRVGIEGADGGSAHSGRALVVTGPGIHRAFPHEPSVASKLFHCDSRREEFARLPEDRECDVGIVGGGEARSAA